MRQTMLAISFNSASGMTSCCSICPARNLAARLEITFGEEAELQVVECRSEYDTRGQAFHHRAQFPDRQQVEQMGLAQDSHRLSLHL